MELSLRVLINLKIFETRLFKQMPQIIGVKDQKTHEDLPGMCSIRPWIEHFHLSTRQ